jgi:N-acyl-D-amino-acid deacylase
VKTLFAAAFLLALTSLSAQASTNVPLIIRNGMIYDGKGGAPYRGDIAIANGRVVAIGNVSEYSADEQLDVHGLAVAPGFINVLSWAPETLLYDGRGVSDVKQGVTLEIFGEGDSFGPLSATSREELLKTQGDIRYDITWTSLGEFLDHLVKKGVSPNVASFIGATTVRTHEVGYANRAPTKAELARMQDLVRQAMREGALGVGSSLIYAPAAYAKTDELVAITQAASEYGGAYISHMRSEGDRFLEALDELIGIARVAHVHAEVYHLKAAGKQNWPKMKQAIARIEAARKEGLSISANMYPYTAGATGLDASMPPWVQEGGIDAWVKGLQDPKIRERVIKEMLTPGKDWESLYLAAGSPNRILLIGFKNPDLKQYTGKSLAEVAKLRGRSPEDTVIDLVIADHTRVSTAYFLMSEDNVKLGLSQPWVSLGSDEGAPAPEKAFLLSNPHPRAYGTFARFLGFYVRDQSVAKLPDAIRRITQLPAQNFKLKERGCIDPQCHADIVVFDPNAIEDHATFDKPREFATGVFHVFVNGKQVLKFGQHTGATPGEVVRGPGWTGWKAGSPAR